VCCCAVPSFVFFGCDDGSLLHFSATGCLLRRVPRAHTAPLTALCSLGDLDLAAPEGTAIASAGADGRLRLWSATAVPTGGWRMHAPVDSLRDERGHPIPLGTSEGAAAGGRAAVSGLSWAGPRGALVQAGSASILVDARNGQAALCMLIDPAQPPTIAPAGAEEGQVTSSPVEEEEEADAEDATGGAAQEAAPGALGTEHKKPLAPCEPDGGVSAMALRAVRADRPAADLSDGAHPADVQITAALAAATTTTLLPPRPTARLPTAGLGEDGWGTGADGWALDEEALEEEGLHAESALGPEAVLEGLAPPAAGGTFAPSLLASVPQQLCARVRVGTWADDETTNAPCATVLHPRVQHRALASWS